MNRVIRKAKGKKGKRLNSGLLIVTQKTNDCSTRNVELGIKNSVLEKGIEYARKKNNRNRV
jgi:hypothetical protein